jgi:hypothetical protein
MAKEKKVRTRDTPT